MGWWARPHIARAIVDLGAAKDVQEAFDRYLGDKEGLRRQATHPAESSLWRIHDAGGVAVIKHSPAPCATSCPSYTETVWAPGRSTVLTAWSATTPVMTRRPSRSWCASPRGSTSPSPARRLSWPQCSQGRRHRCGLRIDGIADSMLDGLVRAWRKRHGHSQSGEPSCYGKSCARFGQVAGVDEALAMDSNIHIAFPLGTNQVTSDDVRIVQSPPTQVEVPSGFKAGLRFVTIKGYVGVEFDIDARKAGTRSRRSAVAWALSGAGSRPRLVRIAQHWKPVLKGVSGTSTACLTGWHLLSQQADGGWKPCVRGRTTSLRSP